jgi:PDZ domain-containing protein
LKVILGLLSPAKLLGAGAVLACIVFALWVLPSSEYIFLPDPAHPVAPLVSVAGGHNPKQGSVYFVDVIVRKATILERLFGGLHKGASLYPASEIDPPGTSSAQRENIDLEDMKLSQQTAAAVALRAMGRKVVLRAIGARIEDVQPGLPAVGKLEPDDVITAVNGRRVTSPVEVQRATAKAKIGAVVTFTLERAGKTLLEAIRTVGSGSPKHPVVGVYLSQATDIRLPIRVSIDAGNIGGPSAGLAFALEVMEKLGRNVVHGHKIAATGEIFPDGSVGPIGGIRQKVIGAREAGVDAFLVPAGDNAVEARKDADGLKIIAVHNFQQALRALATLPPATS